MLRKGIALFFILLFIIIGLILYKRSSSVEKENSIIINNLEYVKNFFSKLDELPYPKGNLILLDNHFKEIHLKERNIPLDQINNLYVIQGSLCSLVDKFPELSGRIYDPKFSSGLNRKCFTYAVTKDRKYFQIGAILERRDGGYKSILVGNYNSGSLIRDYASDDLVKNGDIYHFPYSPTFNFELLVKKVKGNFSLDLKGNCKIKIKSQDRFIIEPTKGVLSNCKIIFKGKKFIGQIIYPDGSLQTLYSSKNGLVQLKIDFYEYNGIETKKSNIVNQFGKMVYSLVKFGDDSDVRFQDNNGNYLIIRGTKFSFESEGKKAYLYLDQGKVDVLTKFGKLYTFLEGVLKGIEANKIFNLTDNKKFKGKISDLVSNIIAFDFLVNQRIDLKFLDITSKFKKEFIERPKPMSIFFKDGLMILKNFIRAKNDQKRVNFGIFLIDGNILKPDQIFPGKSKEFIRSLDSNKILDDMCKSLGYRKSIDINDLYVFVDNVSFRDSKLSFDFNKQLASYIKDKYLVLFKNRFKTSFINFTFWEPIKNSIGYGPISNYDPFSGKRMFEGIALICK